MNKILTINQFKKDALSVVKKNSTGLSKRERQQLRLLMSVFLGVRL